MRLIPDKFRENLVRFLIYQKISKLGEIFNFFSSSIPPQNREDAKIANHVEAEYYIQFFSVTETICISKSDNKSDRFEESHRSKSGVLFEVSNRKYWSNSILFHSILFHFSILFHCFRALKMKKKWRRRVFQFSGSKTIK